VDPQGDNQDDPIRAAKMSTAGAVFYEISEIHHEQEALRREAKGVERAVIEDRLAFLSRLRTRVAERLIDHVKGPTTLSPRDKAALLVRVPDPVKYAGYNIVELDPDGDWDEDDLFDALPAQQRFDRLMDIGPPDPEKDPGGYGLTDWEASVVKALVDLGRDPAEFFNREDSQGGDNE
jgi:hypothetical protein